MKHMRKQLTWNKSSFTNRFSIHTWLQTLSGTWSIRVASTKHLWQTYLTHQLTLSSQILPQRSHGDTGLHSGKKRSSKEMEAERLQN